ncbi:MAG: hypothetical protein R3D00_00085 [Bacteroidia bacterium]
MKRKMYQKGPSAFFARHYLYVMVGLVAVETALLTFWRRELGLYFGPIALVILAFLISFYPLWKNHFHRDERPSVNVFSPGNKRWIVWGIFVAGIATLIPLYHHILQTYPIDIDKSDIIPTIQVCVRRFLNGEPVYAEITEFPYAHYPNYFPFKWLPFVIPEILGIDYRWLPLGVVSLGLACYQRNLIRRNHPLGLLILLAVAPYLILLYYHLHMPWNIAYTVELLDLGYYLMLFVFLAEGKVILSGLSIVVVLLSRLSIVFWLPFYLLGVFIKENKKYAVSLAVIIGGGLLIFFVIPFLSHDWQAIQKGEEAYMSAAKASWYLSEADRESGKIVPHVMRDQVGIASYMFLYAKGEIAGKIRLIQKIHLSVSLGTAILIGVIYLLPVVRIPPRYYFLFTLKIYLGIFYAFIQVPFFYLFITPLFLSLFLLQEMNMDRWNAAADGGSPLQQ